MDTVFVLREVLFVARPARLAHAEGEVSLALDRCYLLAVGLGINVRVAVLATGFLMHGLDIGFGGNGKGKNLSAFKRFSRPHFVVATQACQFLFGQFTTFGVSLRPSNRKHQREQAKQDQALWTCRQKPTGQCAQCIHGNFPLFLILSPAKLSKQTVFLGGVHLTSREASSSRPARPSRPA